MRGATVQAALEPLVESGRRACRDLTLTVVAICAASHQPPALGLSDSGVDGDRVDTLAELGLL